ncbi:MAG: TonB family protein [Rhodoplanes sp.]|uniref:energy transducer TonB family protein n=1 Tax=Rhodoplanes sp. TaxID=1968906 RepID=UPI0017A761C8|nr:TonB family protein [Rhodoplanes sp.]NVO14644.1 TonB family protein [Rhodoplanes sp.]
MTARLRPPALRVAALVVVSAVHAVAFGGLVRLPAPGDAAPDRLEIGVVARGEIALDAKALPVPDQIAAQPSEAPPAPQQQPNVPRSAAEPTPPDQLPLQPTREPEAPQPEQTTLVEQITPETPAVAAAGTAAPTAPPATASAQRIGAEDARLDSSHAAEARYAALVSAAINRGKHYPAGARRRGARGMVTVSFRVDRTGRVVSHAITQSSGDDALDAAAIHMVTAAALPRPPGELFSGAVVIRFRFAE